MTKAEAVKLATSTLGYSPNDLPEEFRVELTDGHSGAGWYAWDAEYPEDGSIFLGGA